MIIIGTTFSLKITGLDDTAILAGLIGFVGAILGGLLTLAGVYLTIRYNRKSKEEEDLPVQIHRIENSKNFLQHIHDVELPSYSSRDPYNINRFFIEVDDDFNIYYTDNFKQFTEKALNHLRDSLTFVDAETYRMFLDTQDKINGIELKDYDNVKDRIMKFQELMVDKYYPEWDREESFGLEEYLNEQEEIRFKRLKGELSKVDRKIRYYLSSYYGDLYIQIALKHESLIEKLKN